MEETKTKDEGGNGRARIFFFVRGVVTVGVL